MIARRVTRRWIPGAALALLVLAPGAARAQSEAEQKAAAQALFDEARKLTADSKYADACPKLAESYRLDPTMGTKFYLAECYEHVGKLASAWSYYLEVADQARAAGQKDREEFSRGRAEALKGRLPSLKVEVSPGARAIPGLTVQRDGLQLGEPQWGLAVPVDLGEHAVTASAPGRKAWEAKITVEKEAEPVTVEVPALSPEPPPAVEAPKPPPPKPAPPPPPPPSFWSGQRIGGAALGVAGLAGIGLGAYFGLQATSKQSESDDGHCDAEGFCDSIGITLRDEAISAATISTIGFIAGGVLLAGGVTLFLTAPSGGAAGARPEAAIVLRPAGMAVVGRF